MMTQDEMSGAALRGVLIKRCSENIQQIYRRTPMPKCDFNKIEITLPHGCSSVNLLYIFRTPFLKNTSEGLLLECKQNLNLHGTSSQEHEVFEFSGLP